VSTRNCKSPYCWERYCISCSKNRGLWESQTGENKMGSTYNGVCKYL